METTPHTTADNSRWIVHADLDAFYASVEQLDNPDLRGKPVLVGGKPESRGVVAAASYEARAFGARSAMPMREAVRRCPKAIVVSPRFARYSELSSAVFARYREITSLVEPLSLDEAYLDISDVAPNGDAAVALARALKARIKDELSLTVSVGVGTAKVVAKIASDLEKPDGFVYVPAGTEAVFLDPLPVERLWGVGPKLSARLHTLGIATIGDLARFGPESLHMHFGKVGGLLGYLARGVDTRRVQPERETKSVSRETTFAQDVRDRRELETVLRKLADSVSGRLQTRGLAGRTVAVKLRYSDFRTVSRQVSLGAPVDSADAIFIAALPLLAELLHAGDAIRLLGVGVASFGVESYQLPLFEIPVAAVR